MWVGDQWVWVGDQWVWVSDQWVWVGDQWVYLSHVPHILYIPWASAYLIAVVFYRVILSGATNEVLPGGLLNELN